MSVSVRAVSGYFTKEIVQINLVSIRTVSLDSESNLFLYFRELPEGTLKL